MGTPSAKRIAAKLGSAPARNTLNITGANGKTAGSPVSIKVAEALKGSMSSGDGGPGKGSPAKQNTSGMYKRKTKAVFGSKDEIKQGDTRKLTTAATPPLPSGKGKVGFPGNGVD